MDEADTGRHESSMWAHLIHVVYLIDIICSCLQLGEQRAETSAIFFFSNIFCFYFAVEVEEEGMSGVQLFFTLLFTVVGLVVLGVVGLIVYGRWKENKRKRFYWGKISQSAECVLMNKHAKTQWHKSNKLNFSGFEA